MIKRIAVFCGSGAGNDPVYAEVARKLMRTFITEKTGLVYGGGKVGLMGVLAEEMLKHKGEVIGVIPQKLMGWELGHTGITKLHIVDTMHDRKAMMADLSDAFIAMPGGIGTLEEFIEVFTWLQLDYHRKPCAIYNPNHYFDKFLDFFEHMIHEGFLKKKFADTLIVDSDPQILLSKIRDFSIDHPQNSF